jgi:AcrR family transcriptional regulator
MDIRDRIIAATKRVYAAHGFRGATTRLIAIEAGVNEVTLFRTFGSKAALFQELMRDLAASNAVAQLPNDPQDPERELTEWCAASLTQMRQDRSLIRKSIAELEERPDAALSACDGPNCAGQMLLDYTTRLAERGLADPEADTFTAVAMFMSALFGDAMCRELMPDGFPQPIEDAPTKYVRTFLRAVGAVPARVRRIGEGQSRPAMTRGRRSAP